MGLVVLGFCCDWFAVGLFMVGFDLLGLVGGGFCATTVMLLDLVIAKTPSAFVCR